MAYYVRHPERYSDGERYDLAQELMARFKRSARITTVYYGTQRLPRESGYIMFANHQGRYDGIGIMSGHKAPCSVLIDARRYKLPIIRQFADLTGSQSIDKRDVRGYVMALRNVAHQVKDGKRYLVFPEGIYYKGQGNRMGEFKYGCFMTAVRTKCPIVPVAVIDSYKPFSCNSLRPVMTKVVFLDPIPYEEYRDMRVQDIAETVKSRIGAEIERHTK